MGNKSGRSALLLPEVLYSFGAPAPRDFVGELGESEGRRHATGLASGDLFTSWGARARAGRPSALRRVCKAGLASAIALGGLVVFATTASAHDNIITAAASCNSPLGTGVTITWTIANDYNENVTGTVTSVTGGLSTLGTPPINFSIAASPGKPYSTTTLTQKLPASQTGVVTLNINSTWHPDNYNRD